MLGNGLWEYESSEMVDLMKNLLNELKDGGRLFEAMCGNLLTFDVWNVFEVWFWHFKVRFKCK
ncbi:MAG: hypothetical protein ACTS4U_00830 [Candidatus Hodgkinia cicadicola]